MEALKHERMITSQLETSIGINGVREGDDFIIDICQERKKSYKLNRTKYQIKSSEQFEFDFVNAVISMPFFEKEKNEFELELVAENFSGRHNNKSRYLFRSMTKAPFRLNGVYCFEAFIERGDVLDIGFNRLHFPKNLLVVTQEKQLSEKLIKSHISVLIEGETGTGKTTLAKKIHDESGRNGKFVHLNLSAFSPGLIESELFGHIKGAFTGAINGKRGAILEAHKGTLFLDEVDSLTMDLQTKLLLFLDNYEVRAVGGEHSTRSDVRIIFASGSILKKKVEEGGMRKDFYYRLQAGCTLSLESLREKPERVRELCLVFENKEAVVFDKELIDFYSTCKWPGNIRQLQSHLMKKKILSDGRRIIFDEMDKELIGEQTGMEKFDSKEILSLDEMKTRYCYDVFLNSDKNITRSAKILKLCPNTLKAYLQKRESELRNDQVIQINL